MFVTWYGIRVTKSVFPRRASFVELVILSTIKNEQALRCSGTLFFWWIIYTCSKRRTTAFDSRSGHSSTVIGANESRYESSTHSPAFRLYIKAPVEIFCSSYHPCSVMFWCRIQALLACLAVTSVMAAALPSFVLDQNLFRRVNKNSKTCLLYTSDAADDAAIV